MSEKTEQKEMQSVEDVEAYLQEVEAQNIEFSRLATLLLGYVEVHGTADGKLDCVRGMIRCAQHADIPRLVAIVREHGAITAAAVRIAENSETAWRIMRERHSLLEQEHERLRDRLAKLEADATQNQRAVLTERDNLLAVLGRLRRAYVRYRKADAKLTIAAAYMADSSGVDLTRAEIESRYSQAQAEHDSSLASLRCVLSDELSIFRDDGFPTRLQSIEQAWREENDARKAAEKERDVLRDRLAKLEVASRAVAVAESAGCVASCHGDADDIADASKRLMVAASNLRRVMDGLPSTLPDETTALRERLAKLEAERQPHIRRKLARLQQSRAKIAHRLDKMDNRHNRANDERALASIDAKIAALGGVAMDPLDERLAKLERDAAALDNNLP